MLYSCALRRAQASAIEQAPLELTRAFACCHSCVRLNGQLIGDPMDCRIFEFARWVPLVSASPRLRGEQLLLGDA